MLRYIISQRRDRLWSAPILVDDDVDVIRAAAG